MGHREDRSHICQLRQIWGTKHFVSTLANSGKMWATTLIGFGGLTYGLKPVPFKTFTCSDLS
jgi:hypothetical protein